MRRDFDDPQCEFNSQLQCREATDANHGSIKRLGDPGRRTSDAVERLGRVADLGCEPDAAAACQSALTASGPLLRDAESLKTTLREAHAKVSSLIAALKRQRRQSRLVQTTLASLKQLQTLDA